MVPTGEALTALQVCEQLPNLTKMGEAIAKSGICGQISASTGSVIALTCAQEGISLVQFKGKYHVMTDGTLAVKSRYLHAEFNRRGGKIHINKMNDEECDLTFNYKGETLRYRVTIAQFKENGVAVGKGGILKTNWRQFPMDMLFARCCATAIRKLCPEADGGLYAEEEIADKASPFDYEDRPTKPLTAGEVKTRIETAKTSKAYTPEPQPEPTPEPPSKPAPEPNDFTPEPSPEPEVVDPNDANICPVPGKIFGKAWNELNLKTLEKILKQPADKFPELTQAHRDAINKLMTVSVPAKDPTDTTNTTEGVSANE